MAFAKVLLAAKQVEVSFKDNNSLYVMVDGDEANSVVVHIKPGSEIALRCEPLEQEICFTAN